MLAALLLANATAGCPNYSTSVTPPPGNDRNANHGPSPISKSATPSSKGIPARSLARWRWRAAASSRGPLTAPCGSGRGSSDNATHAAILWSVPTPPAVTYPAIYKGHLAWTDNASNETGYRTEVSSAGSAQWSVVVTGLVAISKTSHDTGLTVYFAMPPVPSRKSENADYVSPGSLNPWILTGTEQSEP